MQPSGPIFEDRKKVEKTAGGQEVTIIPTQPAGFGCPCHGGQYDTEGNRTAGPPVRALDRYEFSIVNGRLVLLGGYSVAKVDGEGRRRGDPHVQALRSRPARRRARVLALPDSAAALMATTQPKKQSSRLIQVANYPLDWLEERSGLVGGVKYFLFRKVPGDISWYHTLGSATLTAFLVQAITGVILAMYYKPDPEQRVRVDPAHHERPRRSAGSCAACTAGARASSSS